jgi:hypothetical protein
VTLLAQPHRLLTLVVAALGLTCAHEGVTLDSTLRFHNAPPVTAVVDRSMAKPRARSFDRMAYFFDSYLVARPRRAMDGRRAARAANVNAFDEVPNSSWFENRIGVRSVEVSELQKGPAAVPPFAVLGTKLGGGSPGIRVRDTQGTTFLMKFDRIDDPDAETAAGVLVQRLSWLLGYHTSEDSLTVVSLNDLRLDPAARLKDKLDRPRPMTQEDLNLVLARAGVRPDGSYRVLLSKFLPGTPLGGFAQEGTRADDPNDHIRHEERREVRAGKVFFAWLNHIDIKEDNFVDTWIEDPRHPGQGQIRHYLVDFGNSLGIWEWRVDRTPGYAHFLDLKYGLRSLVAFGLWRRPWEAVSPSPLPGVGNFESAHFDPKLWRSRYPWAPFGRFDRYDGFWAAKILMRVQPEHVAAAVAEGRYSDPRTSAFMTRTLIERQRKLGRHYLGQVSPLDSFTVSVTGDRFSLCFDDLLVRHFGAEEPALVQASRRKVSVWDFQGQALTTRPGLVVEPRSCVAQLPLGSDRDAYTIVELETTRPETDPLRVLVHLARDPKNQQLRVIGIRRR